MGEGDERRAPLHAIDDELLVARGLPQGKLEPAHVPCADRELMMLPDVVPVFIDRNAREAVERGDLLVVRNAGHVIAECLVALGDLLVRLDAVGHPAPCAAVGVQICPLPRALERRVRIEEVGAAKWLSGGEAVDRSPRVRQDQQERCSREHVREDPPHQRVTSYHASKRIVPAPPRCEHRGRLCGSTAR
jgi:hypothetical protein